MKRRTLLCGLCGALVVALGCGPGESSSDTATPVASQAPASQAPTPQNPQIANPNVENIAIADGDPPHFQNLIIMTANGGVPGIPGNPPCVGAVTMYRMVGIKRKHKIRWHIQNDPYNGCPGLQISQVQLRFSTAIMSNGIGNGDTPLDTLSPNGNATFIQARIHANPSRAPDNDHAKYLVYYQGVQVSPDPELDIEGDCPNCGPGGGS